MNGERGWMEGEDMIMFSIHVFSEALRRKQLSTFRGSWWDSLVTIASLRNVLKLRMELLT
jgi:hypothetical protein